MLAGGRLLSRLSNHQKTVGVTCASCCVAVQTKWMMRLQLYCGQRAMPLCNTKQAAGCRCALVSASLQWATTASAALPQVTCVTVSPYAGRTLEAAPRLLAGSLDGHVKIYELDTFKVLVAKQRCLLTPEY
jgi:hypothetical protein